MLATHDTPDPEDLFTISAGGFSATADAFARDEEAETLWFLSMVGSQTALKAIWACLLKQPPDTAHLIRGVEGMALSGGYERCVIPYNTIGTWTTKIGCHRPPGGLGRLARAGLHPPGRARLRAGRVPAALAGGGRGPQAPPPLPRPQKPPPPAPVLGHVAVGAGPRNGRDSPAAVLRNPRLPLLPGRGQPASRPVRGGLVGDADGARRGDHTGRGGERDRWIGP